MRFRTMKRLGFFALLIAFFAPLALNAASLNTVKYLLGSELLGSGVVAAGNGLNTGRNVVYHS